MKHVSFWLLMSLFFLPFGSSAQTSIDGCSLFDDGPNETWPFAFTVTTPESGTSAMAQTIEINITSLPDGGANYRVVKTVANGNWNNGNAMALDLGSNVISVTSVSFDRTVKLQFSSGALEFDALTVNDEAQECAGASDDGVALATCSLFDDGPNETWPYAYTVTTPESGTSAMAQTFEINITSLPDGGANYRVVKTVANGNWNNGNAMALSLGSNVITVTEVSFDRTVKLQFSSGALEFDALTVNDEAQECAGSSDDGVALGTCSLFEDGPNETWPYAYTVTTPESGTSAMAQTFEINITSLPDGGANYRVVKTVANGNWDSGNAMALFLGSNVITVTEVSFDRTVKLQFSSGALEFDALTVNDEAQECAGSSDDGVALGTCSLFDDGPNETWPHAYTVTTPESGTSAMAQTFDINITMLPDGGANYRVVKTVANGNWNNGNAMALALGSNVITVTAVSFDRSVKLQFSSGALEFDALTVNGEAQACDAPCPADVDEDDICDDIDDCVGALDALGVCNGSCSADVDADGICDDEDPCVGMYDECGVCNGNGIGPDECDCDGNVLDAINECGGGCLADINENGICDSEETGAAIYCGEGTVWDPETLTCVGNVCSGDLNNDGIRATGDLLMFLGVFGFSCE